MDIKNQNKKPLIPKSFICVDGKVFYNEGNQVWNLIRLKKEVLDEFYQLKEKRAKFSYKMVYYRVFEELEKAIKELKKNNQALPVLVWLYKDETS